MASYLSLRKEMLGEEQAGGAGHAAQEAVLANRGPFLTHQALAPSIAGGCIDTPVTAKEPGTER